MCAIIFVSLRCRVGQNFQSLTIWMLWQKRNGTKFRFIFSYLRRAFLLTADQCWAVNVKVSTSDASLCVPHPYKSEGTALSPQRGFANLQRKSWYAMPNSFLPSQRLVLTMFSRWRCLHHDFFRCGKCLTFAPHT